MKRLILLALAFLYLSAPVMAGTIPISGTIRLPNGTLMNGSIQFVLSYSAARDSCSSNIVVAQTITYRVANGVLPSNAVITGNDCIQPLNTWYTARYLSGAGAVIGQNNFYIQGSSFNIGTAIPTPVTTNNLSFNQFTGLVNVSTQHLNNIRLCDQFTGATADVKDANCIADLPTTGGIADGTSIQGSQTYAACPLTGVTKNAILERGFDTGTFPANCYAESVELIDYSRQTALTPLSSNYTANVLFDGSNGAGTTNRVYGVASQIHATTGGTGVAGQGETVAFYAEADRTGGSRPIWAMNTVTQVASGARTNQSVGYELDFNNNDTDAAISGSTADAQNGMLILSGGTHKPQTGLLINGVSAPSAWQIGEQISNWNQLGLKISAPVSSGASALAAIYIQPGANDTNSMILGRNAADSQTIWNITNSGGANFANGAWVWDGTGNVTLGSAVSGTPVMLIASSSGGVTVANNIAVRFNDTIANPGLIIMGADRSLHIRAGSGQNILFEKNDGTVGAAVQSGAFVLYQAAATVSSGQLSIGSTTAAMATAGGGQATPGTVLGYLIMNLAGTTIKVPYFAN